MQFAAGDRLQPEQISGPKGASDKLVWNEQIYGASGHSESLSSNCSETSLAYAVNFPRRHDAPQMLPLMLDSSRLGGEFDRNDRALLSGDAWLRMTNHGERSFRSDAVSFTLVRS